MICELCRRKQGEEKSVSNLRVHYEAPLSEIKLSSLSICTFCAKRLTDLIENRKKNCVTTTWFAWYPVKTADDTWAWLTTVEVDTILYRGTLLFPGGFIPDVLKSYEIYRKRD